MSNEKVEGKCRICGNIGKLSYEHLPPRGAYNSERTKMYQGNELIKQIASDAFPWDVSGIKGEIQQRGSGGYFICESCNNFTGLYYVKSFISFSKIGVEEIVKQKPIGKDFIEIEFKDVYPLNFLKEIVAMFLVSNNPEFSGKNKLLRDFVLEKENKTIPDSIRISMYANFGIVLKKVGVTGILYTDTKIQRLVSEIVTIPFGFVLEKYPKENKEGLLEMDNFLKYNFNEKVNLKLKIPIKQSNTAYPLDFRSKDEIMKLRKNKI